MADKEIKITFPEQKLEALSYFMGQKNVTVESALQEYIDKAYEKNVPVPVRQFLERGLAEAQEMTAQQTEGESATGAADGERPSRRTQRATRQEGTERPNRRAQWNTQAESAGQPAEGQVGEAPGESQEQEQGQGMAMSM